MTPICPSGPHTHSLTDACILIGCDSEDWVLDRVRNGTFPGRKIVRQVRFSDDDIKCIIDACAVQSKGGVALVPELTERSRRRS